MLNHKSCRKNLRAELLNKTRLVTSVESLESRQLLSVTPGILSINGTIVGNSISINSGTALHVRAVDTINATYGSGTVGIATATGDYGPSGGASVFSNNSNPSNTTFRWDFGDPGTQSDSLTGFNAAHVYDYNGAGSKNYTVTLYATDETGAITTSTLTVTVSDASMGESGPDVTNPGNSVNSHIIYVDAVNGSPSGSGLISSPLKTFGQAIAELQNSPYNSGSGAQVRLARGNNEIYNVSPSDWPTNGLSMNNLIFGAYGSTTLKSPVLNDTSTSLSSLIFPGTNAMNWTIQNLAFSSSVAVVSTHSAYGDVLNLHGTNITLRNCDFGDPNDSYLNGNFADDVDANDTIEGTLFQNVNDHGNWVGGANNGGGFAIHIFNNADDIVLVNNTFTGASINNAGSGGKQPYIRFEPNPGSGRILAENNLFGSEENNHSLFTLRGYGFYEYIADNVFNDPTGTNTPIGLGNGGTLNAHDYAWVTYSDNRFIGSDISLSEDIYETRLSNNVFEEYNNGTPSVYYYNPVISFQSGYTASASSVAPSYLYILSNTFYTNATQATSHAYTELDTSNGISNVSFIDNIDDAPLATSSSKPAVIVDAASQIAGNYGNIFYDPSGSNGNQAVVSVNSGGETATQWNSTNASLVVTVNVDASATSFAPTAVFPLYEITSSNGTGTSNGDIGSAYLGDSGDFYSDLRPPTGSFTSGAVEEETAPTVPVAPVLSSVTAASSSQINLSWTENSTGVTGYVIERSTSGTSGTFTPITPTSGAGVITATSYSDTTVSGGTTYYYEVYAMNAAGNSPVSGAQSTTTPTATLTLASQVTNDVIYLERDSNNIDLDIWQDIPTTNTPRQVPLASISNIVINDGTNNEALIIEWANGAPLPAGGLTVNGGSGLDGLQIVSGSSSSNTIISAPGVLTDDSIAMNYGSLASVSYYPAINGTDSLSVTGGAPTLTIPNGSSTTQIDPQSLTSLSIASGASLIVQTSSQHAGRTVLTVSNFTDAGSLDMGGNDLIIHKAAVSTGTTANLTGGNGSSSVDQYPGTSGSGWVTPWSTTAYQDNNSATVSSSSPLNGGGNYLSYSDTSSNSNSLGGVARAYNSSNGVNTGQPYTISFNYRFDSSTSGLTTANDRVALFGDTQAIYGTGSGNTWVASVYGTAQGSLPALTWGFQNGDKNGNSLSFVSSGVPLVTGTVYQLTITVDPSTDTYVASITDGGTGTGHSFTSGVLQFRAATAFTPSTTTYVNFTDRHNSSSESDSWSLDSLIITQTSEEAVAALVTAGFNNGSENGTGIDSSAAASDTTHLTTLGIIQNFSGGSNLYTTFDGVAVLPTDVLIKYTYFGDDNLDGVVNSTDQNLLNTGYTSQSGSNPLTGWYNGDFNYDGIINGSDYTLQDNAFNSDPSPL